MSSARKITRREFLGLAMSAGFLVTVPAVRFVCGKGPCVLTCPRCGAGELVGHEFEGRLYCPNCGADLKRGSYNLPGYQDAVEAFGGVVFPHPARVKGTSKPVWRMDDLVL